MEILLPPLGHPQGYRRLQGLPPRKARPLSLVASKLVGIVQRSRFCLLKVFHENGAARDAPLGWA